MEPPPPNPAGNAPGPADPAGWAPPGTTQPTPAPAGAPPEPAPTTWAPPGGGGGGAGTPPPPPAVPPAAGDPGGSGAPRSKAPIIGAIVALALVVAVVVVLLTRGGDDDDGPIAATTEQGVDSTVPTTPAPTLDTVAPSTVDTTVSASTEPTTPPAPPTLVPPPLDTSIDSFSWGTELDENSVAVPSGPIFGDDTVQVCLSFMLHGYDPASPWEFGWTVNGDERAEFTSTGTTVGGDEPVHACISEGDAALTAGLYEVTFVVADDIGIADSVYVGGGRIPVTQTFVNQIGVALCMVQVSPTEASFWGLNRLGDDEEVPIDGSMSATFASGSYDVRALDCDGDVVHSQFGTDFDADGQYFLTPN